jgi:hypothetical protein
MNLVLAMIIGLSTAGDLLGTWQYDGYIYQGNRYPSPNPELYLTFTFRANGRVRLFWSRANENGFCEREAQYTIDQDRLFQKIDWVNPDNLPECQNDPDMQLGRESTTRIKVASGELYFYFHLDDDEFIYVLKQESLTHAKENL